MLVCSDRAAIETGDFARWSSKRMRMAYRVWVESFIACLPDAGRRKKGTGTADASGGWYEDFTRLNCPEWMESEGKVIKSEAESVF